MRANDGLYVVARVRRHRRGETAGCGQRQKAMPCNKLRRNSTNTTQR